MKVDAHFLKNLLDFASFRNGDHTVLDTLMEKQHFDLNSGEEMIDAEAYLAVFESVVDASDGRCGLNMGAFFNMSSLGLVLEISLSTSGIKQGIYILENYLKSKFPIVTVQLQENADGYMLGFDSVVEDLKVKTELLNMVLYVVYRELSLMLPKELIPRIRLPHHNEEDALLFFKQDILPDPEHLIVLPRNLDELEINNNRTRGIELLLPKFIAMLDRTDNNPARFSENVRRMVLNMCDPEVPNLKQVRSQFACSERTFQRRLTCEGTSFRKIVNDIKEELSDYLSNEKHLKTKEIAYILGYADASAYLHALKEWKSN